jgi:asparagine synthetase B (glutamine-hydrolysing)
VVEGSGGRGFAAFAGVPQTPAEVLRFAVEGRTAVAFAGFLGNRRAMEQRIVGEPPVADEADLIRRLYSRSGAGVLTALRGGFALLVWDGDRDTLIATHDPVGSHPLFWARSGSSIVLSDSVETLLNLPEVSRDLNRLALADHVRWRWPDPQETFFAALRRVPPGSTMTDRAGQPDVRRTWNPAPEPVQWAGADEVEEFDDRFSTAVERCFSLGRVGISLSGGLDSVTVAAFAAEAAERLGADTPAALSVRFPDAGVNEEDIQRSVASQLGFEMVMIGLDEAVAPFGVLEATLELAKSWPAPMFNPWLAAYVTLGHLGRKAGCRAFVTGGGGDEWLCVSPYLAADLMGSFDVVGLYRLMRGARRSYTMSTPQVLKSYLWTFGVRALGRRALGVAPSLLAWRDRRVLGQKTPDWLAPDPELRRAIDDRWEPTGVPRNFYLRELKEGLDAALVAQELEEFFELGRRVQMPVLRPFLDPDVIDLLARVPPAVLNRGDRSKALVRDTLDRRFPELAFGHQRKVQAIPTLERVLKMQFDALWASVGPPSALAALGVVDPAKLEVAVDEARTQPYGSLWRLFMLQSLEIFVRARL